MNTVMLRCELLGMRLRLGDQSIPRVLFLRRVKGIVVLTLRPEVVFVLASFGGKRELSCSGKAVPIQCPYSARTVPVQCPLQCPLDSAGICELKSHIVKA